VTATTKSVPDADLPFPAVWLRDNCPCGSCRDPSSGQKLFGITDLPAHPAVVHVERSSETVTVTFAPDGHRAHFPRGWLADQAGAAGGDGRTEQDKQLWQADDLVGRMPTAQWSRYSTDHAERLRVLQAVQRLGLAMLRGTPTAERTVLRVAETFGFVRRTNYGELFDVRVEANPSNLAFTGLAIAPHTDNPYRDPVPTMQLLHCLSNAVAGGDSGLVDGFLAATALRTESPASFEVLAGTPVPFAWSDGANCLRAERPLIGVDSRGRIREVRFNHRSMQPLRLPRDEIVAFYAAYRQFAEVVARPVLRLDFRLEPGDCLIFDNVRLLHARTAFVDPARNGAEPKRHLQGCYADMDGLISTLAVLGEPG
jgi:gamma-butyrobetaine dioxygenase